LSNDKNENVGIDYSTLSTGEYTGGAKLLISKHDFDLFDEDRAAIPSKIIRIKRSGINKTERWRILENDDLIFIIEAEKLTKKEKVFLRTLPGMNFLIGEFKCGSPSLSELKVLLKKALAKK